ncbi:lipoate-protein ligase LplJ [Anaerotignum neopropionicum]|uniref:lipoate--protein ligase n=1 Tax=Anaerotignum neopropionicum TaxID=36847 RepID=A0A136WFC6_9FIRM|nr:lipoate--protein ligase [Anaerotignum neopropionicum]KXL53252.1 lipoate-protein ligase LplJ [Anaerotignum neopropionicum]
MSMVYLKSPSTDPAFNLALEQFVFDKMDRSKEYFMLWQNNNAVIVGKNQNTFGEVNPKVVDEKGIEVIRRLSGGGAVYHDLGNLNFTFIMDAKDASDLDIKLFCQPVASLLQKLGADAQVNGRNDITIDGKKFSGNSQYLKEGRIMHHGTLMFNSDLDVVAAVLNVAGDKFQSKAAKSVKSRVTNVKPYLKEDLTMEEFQKQLVQYVFGEMPIETYELTPKDIEEIEKIKAERYALWDWNYGRSPEYTVQKERRIDGCGKIEAHMNTKDGKIVEVKFFGDFFGVSDHEELSKVLEGCEIKREALKKALENTEIEKYFHGISMEQFIEILI